MTFSLVRLGWPNTAVILALAATPIVALVTSGHGRVQPAHHPAVEFAENTLLPEKLPALAKALHQAAQ
jgi:hypothetical protein